MKAAIVPEPKSLDVAAPKPSGGEVRIKVHAGGVCHRGQLVVDATWPGLALRRIPAHGIGLVVESVGEDVSSSARSSSSGT